MNSGGADSEGEQSDAERIDELERQVQIHQSQLQAMNKWVGQIETLLLGSLETGDVDVESVNLLEDLQDLRTAMRVVSSRVEQIEQAPGEGAGAARVAKIRRALVRRAQRSGTATVSQAAQKQPAKMDAGEIHALFDYGIDRSYASELVTKAADGEVFWLKREPVDGNPNDKKVLRVDVTELAADSPYRAVGEEAVELSQINELLGVADQSHAEGGGEGQ